jgi:hypothetical protein
MGNGWTSDDVEVEAGPLTVRLHAGARDWRSWLFAARPRLLRRSPAWLSLEDALVEPLGGRLLGGVDGVHLAGRAPGGQREWYGIDLPPAHRRVGDRGGWGRRPPRPAATAPRRGPVVLPHRPRLVAVTTLIEPLR